MANVFNISVISLVAVFNIVLGHPGVLNRVARSPHYGGFGSVPPPPPPPPPPFPIFRTQNWSGISRGSDSLPQGVYSGAAAVASGAPSVGAVSLASSSDNRGDCDEQEASRAQSGFGGSKTDGHFGGSGNGGSSGGHFSSKSFKESHFAVQGGESHGNGQGLGFSGQDRLGASSQAQAGAYGNYRNVHGASSNLGDQNDQQQYSSGGFGQSQEEGQEQINVPPAASQSSSFASSQSNTGGFNSGHTGIGSGYGSQRGFGSSGHSAGGQNGNFGYHQSHEFGRGFSGSEKNEKSSRYESDFGSEQQQQSRSELANTSGSGSNQKEDISSTVGGALNLASQGLKAQDTGCSTCGGKNGYALSNAKSHSGSAVAVSIGG
ncbi:keratin, type I cytoskeletal 9-like [Leptidea sinapis]|uniref:keratin, type I cytoskeletal 9-like n=1 Tax=Leptidea sinapis TaxID=189913 RepID=UPI0021241545|nr:keratin, type I cytoskeletal 9-like [Leptidea sinapis]